MSAGSLHHDASAMGAWTRHRIAPSTTRSRSAPSSIDDSLSLDHASTLENAHGDSSRIVLELVS